MKDRADNDAPRPKVGELVTGEIADLAYGGPGVLRHDGWVVMVRGAFPGDRVGARIRRRRKGVFEADLEEVITPSPERITPACPHLAICGGCALQGLAPAAQTRYKANQAVELLRRIGKITPGEIATPWQGSTPYFYRNKMEFTFAPRPWVTREELDAGQPFGPGPALGLHPRGVFQGVFNVEDCRLQSQLSNRIVVAFRNLARQRELPAYISRTDSGLLRHLVVRQAATTADLIVIIVARNEDPVLGEIAHELREAVPEITGVVASINQRKATVAQGDYEMLLAGEAHWTEHVLGLTFRIGAASFFQTQTEGGVALIDEVLALGTIGPRDRVLDLYCGIGAFSLPIARVAGEVAGVELLGPAITEARANAELNGITNAAFHAGAVETSAPQPWEGGKTQWDLVLVDPPRSGLHPKALAKVQAIGAPRLIYVSCNPATLARDAGLLVAESGYVARRLRVFDIFPQTPHLESVLLLDRA